jgi:type III secretory pathway lipoprotein EscJ
MESNFNKIYQTGNPIEAEIIIQMLKENGINAVSMNKRDSSYQAFGVIEIYCPSNDVVTALDLINNNPNNEQ